eukprot:TRINITY_DN12196_c0_g1_i2.p1 TRINITY_DN12196_c0_g1~~TRINITY_DN12196_c0_g1_i2.p1  ORF type:complete len:328 (-),score=59.54 TRINITY_DN12196_c0_g1_i2:225-1208(-)
MCIRDRKRSAAERCAEIMNAFDSNHDGVLSYEEQLGMYTALVQRLEKERKKDMMAREYEGTGVIRDQITAIKKKIQEVETDHETRRQAHEKQLFYQAMKERANDTKQAGEARLSEMERRISRSMSKLESTLALETEIVAQQTTTWPKPKPHFSIRLREMRHTEMALARGQQYEEAQAVRARTKEIEANEYRAQMQRFEKKKAEHQDKERNKRDFMQQKLVRKNARFRNKTEREMSLASKLQEACFQNQLRSMQHGLTMEMLKVTRVAHNIPLDKKPRPQTNPSCRGTRLFTTRRKEIPSLCKLQDFSHQDCAKLSFHPVRSASRGNH